MSGRWHAKFWGRSVPAIGRTRIFGGLNSFDSFVQQTTVCWTLFEFFHSNHQYRTFYLYRVTDRMPAAAGRNQCACNPWLLNLTLRRNDQLRRHCRLLSIKTAISTPYLTVSESIPTEIDSVSVLADPYSKTSVFLIFSLQDIADIGSAEVEQRRLVRVNTPAKIIVAHQTANDMNTKPAGKPGQSGAMLLGAA